MQLVGESNIHSLLEIMKEVIDRKKVRKHRTFGKGKAEKTKIKIPENGGFKITNEERRASEKTLREQGALLM